MIFYLLLDIRVTHVKKNKMDLKGRTKLLNNLFFCNNNNNEDNVFIIIIWEVQINPSFFRFVKEARNTTKKIGRHILIELINTIYLLIIN